MDSKETIVRVYIIYFVVLLLGVGVIFQIFKLLREGEPCAALALELYASRLAKSLATVINFLDPEVIVLGGGLSNIDFLYQRVPELWSQWVFSDAIKTKVVKNMYGDSSGVRGAAWLWSEENSKNL